MKAKHLDGPLLSGCSVIHEDEEAIFVEVNGSTPVTQLDVQLVDSAGVWASDS